MVTVREIDFKTDYLEYLKRYHDRKNKYWLMDIC